MILEIGDTIIFYDVIRRKHVIGIVEEGTLDDICNIHSSYGHTLSNISTITENWGDFGTIEDLEISHPEWFV